MIQILQLGGPGVQHFKPTIVIQRKLACAQLGWNGTGALVLGLSSEIRWDWLPALVLGSLIGGFLGAHYSLMKGSRLVKQAFEILALLMGGSLLIRSL